MPLEIVKDTRKERRTLRIPKKRQSVQPRSNGKLANGGVTLVIPAKNEEQNIGDAIDRAIPYCDELIVVDGHSTDRTRELAESFGARIVLDNKKGKGDAIRVGAESATHNIVVFMDADGSHDPGDIPLLTEPIKKKKANLVIGSRGRGEATNFMAIWKNSCDLSGAI